MQPATLGQPFTFSNLNLPQVGNLGFALALSNGPSNGAASIFLATGLAPAPINITPTCVLYLDVTSLLALVSSGASPIGPIPLDVTGSAVLPVPIPNLPSLVGVSVATQAAAPDVIAGGFITSNALTLVFGF